MNPLNEIPRQDHSREQIHWQREYQQILKQRLIASIAYLDAHTPAQVGLHLRSFLTLSEEARRYPTLRQHVLALIARLHPLPLQMGYGRRWEPELRFALRHTHDRTLRISYLNDLAENALAQGNFEQSIADARRSFHLAEEDIAKKGRACRILFSAYRSAGKMSLARRLITQSMSFFQAERPTSELYDQEALGWLRFNQSRLELLREQGRVDDAIAMVEEMVQLDQRLGSPDHALSAALITDRSTLLWVKAHFSEAVADLKRAIEIYQNMGDQFNAKSLLSNLGLVYWSMGEFTLAEKTLSESIDFYQNTGSSQLITYDLGNMGLVYFCQGKLQKAEEQFTAHIEHAREIGFTYEALRGQSNLADLSFYFGDYQGLIDNHKTTDVFFKKHGGREGYMMALLWVGSAEAQLGEKQKGLQKIRKVMRWCKASHMPILEGSANRCLAFFLPTSKRKPYLLHALQTAQLQSRRFEEAGALLQLAEIAETPAEQSQLWQEGADILARIGASAWLENHNPHNPPFLPMVR